MEPLTSHTDTSVKHRNPALQDAFALANWQVEPELNTLLDTGSGDKRHLEPRLMRLLCFLAANQEAVLNRDELVQELWPRVIVNENSLTRAVSELRKHLQSDDLSGSDFIKTIPKRGYQLQQAVRALPVAAAQHASERPAAAAIPHSNTLTVANSGLVASAQRNWRLPAGMLAASMAAILSLWSGQNSEQPAALAALQAEVPAAPLADQVVPSRNWPLGGEIALSASEPDSARFAGIESPVLSADKERFAYIKRDMTGSTVYVGKTGAEAEPVAVFNCQRYLTNLTWSPLGNSLLFASHPSMTPAAMYNGSTAAAAELLSLNLETMEVNQLIEQLPSNDADSKPAVNLTWYQPAAFTPSPRPSGLPG